MKYAKLNDGLISYAPNPILHDGLWYGNPPGAVYEAEWYKIVTYAPQPEAPSGYYYAETWSETEDAIVQGWELVEAPITEEEALVRYANELTGGSAETLEDATETLIKIAMEGK
jgi:hypothetical protein